MSNHLNLKSFAVLLSWLVILLASQPIFAQTISQSTEPANGQSHSTHVELELPEAFCAIYPMSVARELIDGAVEGTLFEEVSTGKGPGNFSWLSWSGDPSAVTLANSLIPPGDSQNYVRSTSQMAATQAALHTIPTIAR